MAKVELSQEDADSMVECLGRIVDILKKEHYTANATLLEIYINKLKPKE